MWERLIRTAKKHLAGILGKETIETDVLITAITQVEAIMNARPITHVSTDPRDLEALTPAKILNPGITMMTKTTDIIPETCPDGDTTRYSFQRARALVDAFWKRWATEYVTSLQERQKWEKTKEEVKAGQLVLLVDEKMRREDWKLGRVTEVMGDETHGRTVKVRTGKTKTFVRDITKVVSLELD